MRASRYVAGFDPSDAAARSLSRQTWRRLRNTFQERPDPLARLRDYRAAGLRRVLATYRIAPARPPNAPLAGFTPCS